VFPVNADIFGLCDVNCWQATIAFSLTIYVLRQSLISAGLIAFGYSQAKLIVFISTSKVWINAAIFIWQLNKKSG
jgi:uncharacterized membrane protein